MTRALILDCDGVLADTERDGHLVAFNQTFEELGFPFRWSEEEYAGLLKIGGGKERMRGYLAAHPEIDLGSGAELDEKIVAVHKRKSEIYIELVDQGRLPGRPGVKRLIEEALDAGWQVAVASTSATRSVEAVLRSVVGEQTRSRIAGVWAGDIVPAKKPAPDIYLLTLRELGRGPDEAVVVEDSESGAAGGGERRAAPRRHRQLVHRRRPVPGGRRRGQRPGGAGCARAAARGSGRPQRRRGGRGRADRAAGEGAGARGYGLTG